MELDMNQMFDRSLLDTLAKMNLRGVLRMTATCKRVNSIALSNDKFLRESLRSPASLFISRADNDGYAINVSFSQSLGREKGIKDCVVLRQQTLDSIYWNLWWCDVVCVEFDFDACDLYNNSKITNLFKNASRIVFGDHGLPTLDAISSKCNSLVAKCSKETFSAALGRMNEVTYLRITSDDDWGCSDDLLEVIERKCAQCGLQRLSLDAATFSLRNFHKFIETANMQSSCLIEVCGWLVEDAAWRSRYYPDLQFTRWIRKGDSIISLSVKNVTFT